MARDYTMSFRKSDLRKPEVVEKALEGPVEIVVDVQTSLVLLPLQRHENTEQIRRLTQTYLATIAALGHDDVSPLILGDVGFIADWPPDERAAFAVGFGEALAESLRTNDPAPALGYVRIMGTRRPSIERPSTPWDPEEHNALLPERVRAAAPPRR